MSKKRQSALDPAVASLVSEGEKRQERRRMSPEDREEAKRQAERQRTTYDIPRGIREAVADAAEREGLTASAVAGALLADGMRRYRRGQISLDDVKEVSISYRWEYTIRDSRVLDILNGRSTLEPGAEK